MRLMTKFTFVLLALLIALVWIFSEWALITISLSYLVSGLIARVAYGWGRKRRLSAGAH